MKTGRITLGAALFSASSTTIAFAGHHKHKSGGHKKHSGHGHKGSYQGHKVPEIDALSGMAVIALVICTVLLLREKFSR